MAYDSGLVARVSDSLATLGERGARQKNVFGGRGFLIGKTTFLVVFENGMLVKTHRDDYQRLLASPGATPFAPNGERPMSTWITVSDEAIAEDPELTEWVAHGLRAVREQRSS
jgi:TfoX/Sxy family transcriptional regulator of competence genes